MDRSKPFSSCITIVACDGLRSGLCNPRRVVITSSMWFAKFCLVSWILNLMWAWDPKQSFFALV